MNNLKRYALIAAGTVFVALGIVGVFIPVLPTTPFLLLAAAAYARSSERFYQWLIHNRLLGNYIRHYREGYGMTLLAKALTMSLLWGGIGVSALWLIDTAWVRWLLLAIALGVSAHLLSLPTHRDA